MAAVDPSFECLRLRNALETMIFFRSCRTRVEVLRLAQISNHTLNWQRSGPPMGAKAEKSADELPNALYLIFAPAFNAKRQQFRVAQIS
eukprot:302410-Pelagomonas_calceolata.AAC.1